MLKKLVNDYRAKRQFVKYYNEIAHEYNDMLFASITWSRSAGRLILRDKCITQIDAVRSKEVLIACKEPFAYNMFRLAHHLTSEELKNAEKSARREDEVLRWLNGRLHGKFKVEDIYSDDKEKEDNEDLNKEKETHIEKKQEAFHRVLRDGKGKVIEDEAWDKTNTTEKTTE